MLSTLDLKVLWRNVCAARGTRPPVAQGLDAFLDHMDETTRLRIEQALVECKKGSDAKEHFELLGWASASTVVSMQEKAKGIGLQCTPAELFMAGCWLLDNGADPVEVLLHPEHQPLKVSALKTILTRALKPESNFEPASNNELRENMPVVGYEGAKAPAKPAVQAGEDRQRLKLRLFGNTAAHTLEISDHRRASSFLGVSVVVIESAYPAPQGFDWENKLSIQLTPEEMPEVVAVLLGIRNEAIFSNHGADRNKSVVFRNQKDGLQLVTSSRSRSFSVPVKTSVVYYLLDLFCRAMIGGTPGRTNADVIATVRGVYS